MYDSPSESPLQILERGAVRRGEVYKGSEVRRRKEQWL